MFVQKLQSFRQNYVKFAGKIKLDFSYFFNQTSTNSGPTQSSCLSDLADVCQHGS